MTAFACVLILLGVVALWLDLGNRLFGSYARNPVGSIARVALMVVVLMALAAPVAWLWIDSTCRAARVLAYSAALLGVMAFIHFVFPYRWGIVRVAPTPTTTKQPLVPGLVLTDCTLEIEQLPKAANGLTCLVLSDLHCNAEPHLKLLRGAVDLLQERRPDLVFLLGDFGENQRLLPEVVATVARLAGRLGTYCVLGNHDCEGGRQDMLLELLSRHGVQVLRDEFHDLPDVQISLLGLAIPWSRCVALPKPRGGFVLGLTHSPDNLLHFDRLGASAGFAGHTHGGKLRTPGVGAILVPSRLGRFLDEGWFRRGNTLLYLTRGIGYFPGRFGNVGEICRFTLRPSSP